MPGVYSLEDLLKLRASPLVCKPPGLPPIEEWMGNQDVTNKRPTTARGRQDDGGLLSEGFQKRPAFDSAQRKHTADSERIVLGPPRRSFASSSGRPLGKHESDEPGIPKSGHHERSKTGEDLDSKVGERRGFGAGNRFSNRHDPEGAFAERPRRRNDEGEGEARPRREYDKPKWGARDGRDDKSLEEHGEELAHDKPSLRRDQGRAKFEQPWFRGDRANDDGRRENERGWRRDRVKDGDWDTPGRNEVDPEWMDSLDHAEPQQAHTQEDFQRWKERMKAGSGPPESKQELAISTVETSVGLGHKQIPATSLSGLISPDPAGNSMDKFFARFSEKKGTNDDAAANAKPATKTRFASIFGPQSETKIEEISIKAPEVATVVAAPVIRSTPAPPAPPVVDADQAGFQRILQMLGKRETPSTQPAEMNKPKTPFSAVGQSHQRNASPDLVSLFKSDLPARQTPVSQTSAPPGLERLIDSRSPMEGQTRTTSTPNKDELLLNLLRQAEISAKPHPHQPQSQSQSQPQHFNDQRSLQEALFGPQDPNRNGSRPVPDQDRPPLHDRGGSRGMFDDAAISSMSFQEEMRSRDNAQRRPMNGLMTGGFDEQYLESLRANGQQQKSMYNVPPGLQRPPGLGEMPRMPPGWTQQHGPPPQARQGPPPGLGSRGMMPPFGNPQQQPPPMPPLQQQGPNQSTQRLPPQRKYTGESPLQNFPPGMGPPPAFMAHGVPPGFQHASAAQAAQNYGRFAMGGNGQGQQQPGLPPPNMGRAFMEMYENSDRSGLRGGNGGAPLPPGLR